MPALPNRGVKIASAFAIWVLPALFCLWLYGPGIHTWFQQDDFAWLGLPAEFHKPSDLWRLLFQPMAQGTIRPISERAFFLIFTSLFGIDALPFRIWVFLTQVGSLVLVSGIVLRLTRSRLAAALAPLLWLVNSGLMVPMSWTSSYNQVLCGFFLLSAFALFLKFVETGKPKYYILQLIVFVLGFGVLELNVAYPALVLAYTVLLARPFIRPAVLLLIPSILFTVAHRMSAPAEVAPGYGIHFDERIFATLSTYWQWLLGPALLGTVTHVPDWFSGVGTAVLTTAVIGYVAYKAFRKQYLPLFFLIWILVLLAPILPLPGHISDYYVALPSIGIAMLGALAISDAASLLGQARNARTVASATVAAGCVFLYVYSQLPITRVGVHWWYERGRRAEALVEGVASASERHQRKTILLTGVDNDLFWSAVYDSPFRLYGISNVFLVPGSERAIQYDRNTVSLAQYLLPPRVARRALDQNEAVVYDASQIPIRNITTIFSRSVAQSWPTGLSPELIVTEKLYADQVGEGWYDAEQGFRWTKPRALAKLGRGDSPPHSVSISGFCVELQTRSGPLGVLLSANGKALGRQELRMKDAPFELKFPLPASLREEKIFEIQIDVDHPTIPPGESRELGLAVISLRLE
ncbi:MAG: hypothetical protein NTY38_16580 [Acidobacteria bacterium]|nr:hypothetical protein [Acidobacteriota bacterium]